MAKVYHFHSQPDNNPGVLEPKATPQKRRKLELVEQMLDDFSARLRSRRCKDGKVKKTLGTIKEFQAYSKKFPWEWSRESFEHFCANLFKEKHNAVGTQRGKQKEIKEFTEFLIDSRFYYVVKEEFGITIKPICFPDNMIVHKVENDNQVKRRSFTSFELEKFFDKMDDYIYACFETRSKTLNVAMRDKALFSLMAFYGLRDFEVSMLDIDDIYPNPDFPIFEDYGYIHVRFGKSSSGSSYKERRVYTMDIQAKEMLKWYVTEIRPLFMGEKAKDIKALFYSERGNRVSPRSMQINFKNYLYEFGMFKEGLTPHSMRHTYSSVNQENNNASSHLMQRQLGHSLLSTTQGYTHIGDPFIRKSLNSVIRKNLRNRQDQNDEQR
jgi:site-specific recombinase XerD